MNTIYYSRLFWTDCEHNLLHYIVLNWLWTQFTTLDCSELTVNAIYYIRLSELTNDSGLSLRLCLCNLLFLQLLNFERFLHGWFSILQLDLYICMAIMDNSFSSPLYLYWKTIWIFLFFQNERKSSHYKTDVYNSNIVYVWLVCASNFIGKTFTTSCVIACCTFIVKSHTGLIAIEDRIR